MAIKHSDMDKMIMLKISADSPTYRCFPYRQDLYDKWCERAYECTCVYVKRSNPHFSRGRVQI